jgi:hypothetical protein
VDENMFILYNKETCDFETFTVEELLDMINRDRSDEFSAYDENSTIKELTEIINTMCEPYTIPDTFEKTLHKISEPS